MVERLHHLWDLLLRHTVTRRKEEIGPLAVLYTGFIELHQASGTRKVWLNSLLDHRTKCVPGFTVGEWANPELATLAWTVAERNVDRVLGSLEGVTVHQDQIFTGDAWTARLMSTGVRVPRATGRPVDGRLFRTVRVEYRLLVLEHGWIEELAAIVRDRINHYNRMGRHFTLAYCLPLTTVEDFYRIGLSSTITPELGVQPFWGSINNKNGHQGPLGELTIREYGAGSYHRYQKRL